MTTALTIEFFESVLDYETAHDERSKLEALLPEMNRQLAHIGAGPEERALFVGVTALESDRYRTTKEYASGEKYEGRKGLGNIEEGDGPRYKGRGVIQLTGRKNYSAFAAWLGDFDIITHPDRVADETYLAVASAIYYWSTHKAEDTGRTCQQVANDSTMTLYARCISVNSIVFRGEEIPTDEIAHWDLRLRYTQAAASALGVQWT